MTVVPVLAPRLDSSPDRKPSRPSGPDRNSITSSSSARNENDKDNGHGASHASSLMQGAASGTGNILTNTTTVHHPRRSSLTFVSSRAPTPSAARVQLHQQDYSCPPNPFVGTGMPVNMSRKRLLLSTSEHSILLPTMSNTNIMNGSSTTLSNDDHYRTSSLATIAHLSTSPTTTGGGSTTPLPGRRTSASASLLFDRQGTTLSPSVQATATIALSATPQTAGCSLPGPSSGLSAGACRSNRPSSSPPGISTYTFYPERRRISLQNQPLSRSTHSPATLSININNESSTPSISSSNDFSSYEGDVAGSYRAGQRSSTPFFLQTNSINNLDYLAYEGSLIHLDPLSTVTPAAVTTTTTTTTTTTATTSTTTTMTTTTTRLSLNGSGSTSGVAVGSGHAPVPWMRLQPSPMQLQMQSDMAGSLTPFVRPLTEPSQVFSQDQHLSADRQSEDYGRGDDSPELAILPDGHSGIIMASPGPALSSSPSNNRRTGSSLGNTIPNNNNNNGSSGHGWPHLSDFLRALFAHSFVSRLYSYRPHVFTTVVGSSPTWPMVRVLNMCHLLYLIPVTTITVARIISTEEICDEQLYSWLTVQAFLFVFQIVCAAWTLQRQVVSSRMSASLDQRSRILLLVLMIWTVIGVGFLGADSNSRDPTCGLPMTDPIYALSFKIVVFHVSMIGLYFMPCSSIVLAQTFPSTMTTGLSRTATKPMIDRLGSMPMIEGMFGDDPEEAICAICLGEYNLNETIRFLPCQHHFHLECVDQWLLTDKSCPLCKHDIDQPIKIDRPLNIRLQALNNMPQVVVIPRI